MRPADTWKDYELLDATDGNRLERWGETLLVRPDPQVVWPHHLRVRPDKQRLAPAFQPVAVGGIQQLVVFPCICRAHMRPPSCFLSLS